MKFHMNEVIIWLLNGNIRTIPFKKNKVNVITGGSGTGKSEILTIIDYCLCGSTTDITDEIINENVSWYGINFTINNSTYTIGRGRIVNRQVSNQYYVSQIGEIPKSPNHNIDEKEVKVILDQEFSITERTIFPIGGKDLRMGSKISSRYFLVFNTLSGNVIADSDVFFDKQNIDRYRVALGTTFDLVVGIETEDNLQVKEKVNRLKQELKQLRRQQTAFNQEKNVFMEDIQDLIKQAKQHNLIELNQLDVEENIKILKEVSQDYKQENIDLNFNKINKLKLEKNNLIRKVRNLKRFTNEYDEYKKLEKNTLDSLLPINIIKESQKIFEFPELRLLVNSLTEEYENIKSNLSMKQPFDFNVSKKLKEYEKELDGINKKIVEIPINNKSTVDEVSKLLFIGKLRAKLELYGSDELNNEGEAGQKQLIDEKEKSLEELELKLVDYEENRNSILSLLDELIDTYLIQSEDALDNYKGFKSSFKYKEKKLELRRPKAAYASKVGSSSNHMFLHICLFLGLHELIILQKSPYVPGMLILDQPSRPYYGEEEIKEDIAWDDIKHTDKGKITIAMKLLDNFISYVYKELDSDFQIILLEHIPDKIWIKAKLENFYLVEEFRHGNALIRFDEFGEPY